MGSERHIVICMGSSCHARGNEQNYQILLRYLEENSLEAKVDFSGSLCSGNCSKGPNLSIDGRWYSEVDEGTLWDILDEVFAEE